jgi:hypothetical protein
MVPEMLQGALLSRSRLCWRGSGIMPQRGLSVATAEEILSGPNYFFCEKFECRMHRRQCLINQERGKKSPSLVNQYKWVCLSCPTGKKIRAKFKDLLKEIRLRDSFFNFKTKENKNLPEQREEYTQSEEQMTRKKETVKRDPNMRIYLYLDECPELYQWLKTEAEANERNVIQQTRFTLKQAMVQAQSPRANAIP